MKPFTERLIQLAAVVALVFYGYSFVETQFVKALMANQHLSQQLQTCVAK